MLQSLLYKLPSVWRLPLANLWMTFKSLCMPLLFLCLSLRCPLLSTITHTLSPLPEKKASEWASEPATSPEEAQTGDFCQRSNLHNTKSFCFQCFELETGGCCGNNCGVPFEKLQDKGVEYSQATETRGFMLKTLFFPFYAPSLCRRLGLNS